jgi:hypothetical protein
MAPYGVGPLIHGGYNGMQDIKYAGVVIALLMAGSVMAQQETAKTNAAAPVSSAPAADEVKVPSEEEIKAFVTEYKASPESTTKETFHARFSAPRLKPDQKKKYDDAKTAPFQLTLDLVKYQTVDSKMKYAGRVDTGTASFVILDEEGKVVKAMSENLIKLCSS